jgi:hypothetical protein
MRLQRLPLYGLQPPLHALNLRSMLRPFIL